MSLNSFGRRVPRYFSLSNRDYESELNDRSPDHIAHEETHEVGDDDEVVKEEHRDPTPALRRLRRIEGIFTRFCLFLFYWFQRDRGRSVGSLRCREVVLLCSSGLSENSFKFWIM